MLRDSASVTAMLGWFEQLHAAAVFTQLWQHGGSKWAVIEWGIYPSALNSFSALVCGGCAIPCH